MVTLRQLGLMDYATALLAQANALSEVQAGGHSGIVLGVRHPAVITLGRRATAAEVHVERWARRARGIGLYWVDRGGGATFHYPAQAVVYPIVHLARLGLTIDGLIACIGEAVLGILANHGIDAVWDTSRPGAYRDGAKIASVGLHLHGEFTTHGVALNVGPGLEGFGLIDPCKVPGQAVTSMETLCGRTLDADRITQDLAARLTDLLQSRDRLARFADSD